MHALEIKNLTKEFKLPKGATLKALDNVSFTVEQGEIHGLLGPNGAGKSTLISLMSSILRPTSGSIAVAGVDVVSHPEQTKQMLGVVPQELVVEMAFTVEEVLYYFSGMYGVPESERQPRIDAALNDLDLTDKKKERARGLSGGMKRRLMIAKALIHKPKLLVLDEPTAGVDVALRQKIWALTRRLQEEGTTILFTTHYLEEVEKLCDRITVIDHGHIVKDGALREIQDEFTKNIIHFELFKTDVPHLPKVVVRGNMCEYPLSNVAGDVQKIAAHYGENLKSIRNETASLEEIFLELTK